MSEEQIEKLCSEAKRLYQDFPPHVKPRRSSQMIHELATALVTLSAELAKAREACEQGKARCQNFLNGLLPACGPMTSATAVMISSIQNDFKEALGHDFEAEVKPLAAKGPTNE